MKLIWEILWLPHTFFGIFLTDISYLNKCQRFILFYIRINILLALTSMLSKNFEMFLGILLSTISSQLIIILICLVENLFKIRKKKKYTQVAGIFLSVLYYLLFAYAVITNGALMGLKKSN